MCDNGNFLIMPIKNWLRRILAANLFRKAELHLWQYFYRVKYFGRWTETIMDWKPPTKRPEKSIVWDSIKGSSWSLKLDTFADLKSCPWIFRFLKRHLVISWNFLDICNTLTLWPTFYQKFAAEANNSKNRMSIQKITLFYTQVRYQQNIFHKNVQISIR